MARIGLSGTQYSFDSQMAERLHALACRVVEMRRDGPLTGEGLYHLGHYFRIKTVYSSNSIEGNRLTLGETRQVVEQGLTIAGRSLKDHSEARNLGQAVDLMESMVRGSATPISVFMVRQLHELILRGIDDANAGGYRTSDVRMSGSAYEPPAHFGVPSQMTELDQWLQAYSTCPPTTVEEHVSWFAKAVAAHAWLVYIHPFIDGNGRAARLLMGLLLMRGGWPVAVISREDRHRYYDALEESQASDLTMFLALVAECVQESLEEYEFAQSKQLEQREWAADIAAQFAGPHLQAKHTEYEVWRHAMDLLRSQAKQAVEAINAASITPEARAYFKEFGALDFEKYIALANGRSAKRTWFLRIDFVRGSVSARYLLFFGSPSRRGSIGDQCAVTLHLSRETEPGYYERLDEIRGSRVPTLREIGYAPSEERYAIRVGSGEVQHLRVETAVQRLVQEVIEIHFTRETRSEEDDAL